jgi:hypothetical protein
MTLAELLDLKEFGVQIDTAKLPGGFFAVGYDPSKPGYSDKCEGGTVGRFLYCDLEELASLAPKFATPADALRLRSTWDRVYSLALISAGKADLKASVSGETAGEVSNRADAAWSAYSAW